MPTKNHARKVAMLPWDPWFFGSSFIFSFLLCRFLCTIKDY